MNTKKKYNIYGKFGLVEVSHQITNYLLSLNGFLPKTYGLQGCILIAYSFKQFNKLDLVCYLFMLLTIFDLLKLWLFKNCNYAFYNLK